LVLAIRNFLLFDAVGAINPPQRHFKKGWFRLNLFLYPNVTSPQAFGEK